jgi:hypothetical protein
MRVVEDTLGPEHLGRYLRFMWAEYIRTRAAPPLLRATDSLALAKHRIPRWTAEQIAEILALKHLNAPTNSPDRAMRRLGG